MEDKAIVDLFFARSETAIEETQKKYGRYCHAIAKGILSSEEDAKECVSDAYVGAWNSIPPQNPENLQHISASSRAMLRSTACVK